MADVEPHGGGPSGTSPEGNGRKRSHDPAHFLCGLKKCMGHGLQQRGNLRNGATEPDFRWGRAGHYEKIAEALGGGDS
jgi:hypothetical protein